VRRSERRMPGERHLVGRREDAHVRGGTIRRNTNVVSERLNCSASACIVPSSMPRALLEHRKRIACERLLGEDVDDPNA
jgi:hypothetical protein